MPRKFSLLIICGLAGIAMTVLFTDSCQQDAGLHFLYARWAWKYNSLFVGVWSRPLFTFVYSFPALIGYTAARLFTVFICLATAWQTWRLAEKLRIERSPLVILLMWLQPSFFLFCADTMTEPIFALVFVIALRFHFGGYLKTGMLLASLLILARPEGFFLGILWAFWILFNWKRTPWRYFQISILATGSFIWWLAAYLITGDRLFIKHNWPVDWPVMGTSYGAAGLAAYPLRLPEIVGPFLLLPFIFGMIYLLKRRELNELTGSFFLLFILHTILRAYGMLGSAGYPRYLVTISPATAIVTLVGWNRIAEYFSHTSRFFKSASAVIILLTSAYLCFVYADGAETSRDARAVSAVCTWFAENPRPINRLIWGQTYACIFFDRDPWENPEFSHDRAADIKMLSEMKEGTLAVWDEGFAPKWFGVNAQDFIEAGFVEIYSQDFRLNGYILDRSWFGNGGPRIQRVHLLYKTGENAKHTK